MRNLKKILALALALVMSLSLMATANAFTDDDSITDTYETAVTVLSGLKVFQGYDDGTFQPKGAITRAEVAAIIYRIVTGDVADTQVGIYADYNKFDDVASTSWYAGYVNFCANAEYIKGYDARTFGPNDPVTGYQALAMILRALGYDKNGEFTGTNWTIQTAAVGEQRGITKNITAGTLSVPATREVVAEILFRAILVPTVNYTPAFGYTIGDTSLGYKTFGLEEITGVVVANEYADLYSDSPMKAGRTELDVDGESYVIDYSTTLEDIGEAHAAYITGSTVLTIEKTGNTVFETGAEASISSDSKFEDVTGLERGDETEYFVNFDGGDEYKASDWKIKYVVETNTGSSDDDSLADFIKKYGLELKTTDFKYEQDGNWSYTKTVKPGATITDADLANIKAIFDAADADKDLIIGAVYVGTQSNEDISDEYSYKQFKDKYIETDEDAIEVTANENGNWLKVVDVDGDGVADYVMKTIYTFAVMEDINRDDEIELTSAEKRITHNIDSINDVDEDIDIVCADELAEGDVVYYAVIDGNAQTYLADMVTAEIDKVDRRNDTAITTDGDEYVESAVCNHTNRDYYDEVTEMAGDVSYDMYLDKFGYLGVFIESATTGEFTLIVNGWYDSLKSGDEYSALIWNGEDLETVDLTKSGSRFIDKKADYIDNNGWEALRAFGENQEINFSGNTWNHNDYTRTTVATLSDDGKLTPVDEVFTRKDVNLIDLGRQYVDDSDWYEGNAYYSSDDEAYDTVGIDKDTNGEDVELRALSTTVYYFVYRDGDDYDDVVVNEYVGYKNVPTLDANSRALIEDVYAVGTRTSRDYGDSESTKTDYYTANVIVVEFSGRYLADAEQVFIVDTPVVGTNVSIDEVEVIREDGTNEIVKIDLEQSVYPDIADMSPTWANYGEAGDRTLMPGLYYMWETKDEGVYSVTYMDPNDIKASNDYVTGEVETSDSTMGEDWVSIHEFTFESYDPDDFNKTATRDYSQYILTDESKLYTLSYDESDDYDAALNGKASASVVLAEYGDHDTVNDTWANNTILVAYNSDDEVVYAISFANFDGENDDGDAMVINFAQDVWNSVKPAGDPEPRYELTVNNYLADQGVSYALTDEAGNPVAPGLVAPGTYTLAVEVEAGYTTAYYVADDGKQLSNNGTADQYDIEVTNADVVVEITGAGAADVYTVKYDADAADVTNPADGTWTVATASSFELPEVTREGYDFVGWYTAGGELIDAAEDITLATFGTDTSVTLTAQWTAKDLTIEIQAFVGGTEISIPTMNETYTMKAGTTKEITFDNDEYRYEVNGKFYDAGDPIKIGPFTKNTVVEVYAWQPITRNVSIVEKGQGDAEAIANTNTVAGGPTDANTWDFTVDSTVDTGVDKITVNYKITSDATSSDTALEIPRTVYYTYQIGAGEAVSSNAMLWNRGGTFVIELDEPLTSGDVTITITSVTFTKAD